MQYDTDLPPSFDWEERELHLLKANLELYVNLKQSRLPLTIRLVKYTLLVVVNLAVVAVAVGGALVLSGAFEVVAAVSSAIVASIVPFTTRLLTKTVKDYLHYDEDISVALILNEGLLEAIEVVEPERAKRLRTAYRAWMREYTLGELPWYPLTS